MLNALRDFLKLETASGMILVVASVVAMVVANSPLQGLYASLIELPVEVRVGEFQIAKPMLLWINDGLMALFFLMVGLELKREIVEGELSDMKQAAFPAMGAIGGMLVPALIYVWINQGDSVALQGGQYRRLSISPSRWPYSLCLETVCRSRCEFSWYR